MRVHKSVGLMAGGTSLVINPLRVAQTLKWSGPGATLLHYLPPKVVGKGGSERNGSIYAQFGSIENRLALNPH